MPWPTSWSRPLMESQTRREFDQSDGLSLPSYRWRCSLFTKFVLPPDHPVVSPHHPPIATSPSQSERIEEAPADLGSAEQAGLDDRGKPGGLSAQEMSVAVHQQPLPPGGPHDA